jgi:hypothetical protein
LSASERDEEERAAWRAQAQAEFPAEKLVFVDESGCNLALTPLYGWALVNDNYISHSATITFPQ